MTLPSQAFPDVSALEGAWRRRQLVVLAPPEQQSWAQTLLTTALRAELEATWGPGVVVDRGCQCGCANSRARAEHAPGASPRP